MGKTSKRKNEPNRGQNKQSSSCSIPLLPELLSIAEETAAVLLAFEASVAASNGVVPDWQPNPDDDPNVEDVLDEAVHDFEEGAVPDCQPPLSDATTIPTWAPTSSHGDLSFLQDEFLLGDDHCEGAAKAFNNKDATKNPTRLLTQKVSSEECNSCRVQNAAGGD